MCIQIKCSIFSASGNSNEYKQKAPFYKIINQTNVT